MLHENAKQRLWRTVPDTFELEWFDPLREQVITRDLSLDRSRQIRWARQGSAVEYPCIYLNVQPQGQPRGDIGHIFNDGVYKEDVPDDDTVAYREITSAPQTARLTVTVAAKSGTRDIPKRVVADQLAIDTWHEFRFHSDHLQEEGVTPSGAELDYAWPMRLVPTRGGMDDTSRMLDEQAVERRVFEFDIEYAYFDEREIPATDKIRWQIGVDRDYDGEAEDWSDVQELDVN